MAAAFLFHVAAVSLALRRAPLAPRRASLALRACAADGAAFSSAAWAATDWRPLRSKFDRLEFVRSVLDGGFTPHEVNHAVWRALEYVESDAQGRVGGRGALSYPHEDPRGLHARPPDVMGDAAALAALEAALPLDDDDELDKLRLIVDTLHGEELTRILLEEGDPEFAARFVVARWLYWTVPALGAVPSQKKA